MIPHKVFSTHSYLFIDFQPKLGLLNNFEMTLEKR